VQRIGAVVADRGRAMALLKEAASLLPLGHPRQRAINTNLSVAMRADSDDAILVARHAVLITPDGDPRRANALTSLGHALQARYDRTGEQADLEEAFRWWAEAARLAQASAPVRIAASRMWARAAARWRGLAAAVQAYTTVVGLLPLLAWRGVSALDQQDRLRVHAPALASEAAASMVATGQPAPAVELLDSGRGVFWAGVLDSRTDLTRLMEVAPGLATELAECRSHLDRI
jgi:hypothetical protein